MSKYVHKFTDEQEAFLRQQSGHSASETVQSFYDKFKVILTRNAIIGKMNRLGVSLSGRKGGGSRSVPKNHGNIKAKSPKAIVRTPMNKVITISKSLPPKPLPPEKIDKDRPPLMLSLEQLDDCHCKWPIGEVDFKYCGHPVVARRKPYCSVHSEKKVDRTSTLASLEKHIHRPTRSRWG